ncbi:MAG: transglutaminase domain-containing protein [Planctomycetes bacterium]|nr:transglutaminase domain-containing protein [Planctomycetota bacterium]
MTLSSKRLAVGFCAAAGAVGIWWVSGLAGAGNTASRTASAGPSAPTDAARVTIQQIAAAIKTHIAEKTAADGGFFHLQHPQAGKELRLKLVRVHMEYLSELGGGVQFACVDLADTEGDVYDVDFFLAGTPGAMTVTETTVHKLNGQPYYAWKQQPDGTWRRISVDAASPRELGVITGVDRFEFRYRADLPDFAEPARMWLPFPESDEYQNVEIRSIQAPGRREIVRDRDHANRILFLDLTPADGGGVVEIVFGVERREKAANRAPAGDVESYLKPDRLVPVGGRFEQIAQEVLKDKDGELVRPRALYDHVIDSVRYMKYGDRWGNGDANYACDVGTGNCTEFHSYFMALARSDRIPSRFAIGVAIPAERDEGGIDGYHCWAEFYADEKWWPVDISEGDKYSRLATYYFGRQPANRFELSRGRDLVVDPLPASGPINFLAYPLLEVGGRPASAKVEFSFTRAKRAAD